MPRKNCVADFYIALRSETIKQLPLSEEELLVIVRQFRSFSRGRALKLLFRFNYGTREMKSETLNWFKYQANVNVENIIAKDFCNKILLFSDEQFSILADELLFQRKMYEPDFLDVTTIRGLPNCENELTSIRESMKEHPVLLFRIVEKCAKEHKQEYIVSNSVVRLLSNVTASQYIGLEYLGFNFRYRVVLHPFAKEIAALLLSMHKEFLRTQKLLSAQDIIAIPLIDLLTKMRGIQKSEADTDIVLYFEKELLKFLELSCKRDSKLLAEYQDKLINLGKAIIDVLECQLEIYAIESELAENNLGFAGEKNSSILLAAVTNIDLTKRRVSAEKTYTTAVARYRVKFECFENFLKTFV